MSKVLTHNLAPLIYSDCALSFNDVCIQVTLANLMVKFSNMVSDLSIMNEVH